MLREEREEYIKNALDWLRGAASQGHWNYYTVQMTSQANSGNLRKIIKEGSRRVAARPKRGSDKES